MVKQTPDEPALIPTRSRDQLPRGFSYPLSATLISDALRDASQFDRLTLAFHARPQESPLPSEHIMFAGIECRSREDVHVWVSAVPSDLADRARQFALHQGLEYLRTWLGRRRDDTWFLHRHRSVIAVDPITNEGIMAEFEEQRLIEQRPAIPLAARSSPGRTRA